MSDCIKSRLNVCTGHSKWAVCSYSLSLFVLFTLAGCGDFFARKPTEIESRVIINDISQVRENPNIKNPLPKIGLSSAYEDLNIVSPFQQVSTLAPSSFTLYLIP